jgi:monofunctional glycosyltransferase
LTEQPVVSLHTETEPSPSRLQRIIAWARAHKWKTALLLIGAFILFEILTLPYYGVYRLKTENPTESALMRQRLDEAEDEGKPLKITQRWIPLSRVPRHVINAIIVAEDGTFYEHGGIDWFEVQESFEKNLAEGRPARGASTITQQLAKNLFLSTSKDPIRKLKEVAITLMMERVLTKQRILELYLNIIEWGRGIFGIEAASRTYFGKSTSALTIDEATRLAAVIPSPLRHQPNVDSRYVVRRKAIVLGRMSSRNWLDHLSAGQKDSTAALTPRADDQPSQPSTAPTQPLPDTTATDQRSEDGLQGRQTPD